MTLLDEPAFGVEIERLASSVGLLGKLLLLEGQLTSLCRGLVERLLIIKGVLLGKASGLQRYDLAQIRGRP